jgi:uncharacterized phage protein (TIGR01671 family)
MNRPIKFRAWNHRYKKMFDVVNIDLDTEPMTGYVNFDGNEGDVWDAIFDGIDHTLMQYTSLKDKNGKEIYEGDIVRYKERMDDHGDIQILEAEVFYESIFALFALGKNNKMWNYFMDTCIWDIEVIGNIFENKEPIKQLMEQIKKEGCYDSDEVQS